MAGPNRLQHRAHRTLGAICRIRYACRCCPSWGVESAMGQQASPLCPAPGTTSACYPTCCPKHRMHPAARLMLTHPYRGAYTAPVAIHPLPQEHFMDHLWPQTARFDEGGELWLGGCAGRRAGPRFRHAAVRLRRGDPARPVRASIARRCSDLYPGSSAVAYAAKAYLSTALAQLFAEEGLDLDVVSGGELYVALAAGFPAERIHFHGNNKSPAELARRWRPASAASWWTTSTSWRCWTSWRPGADVRRRRHLAARCRRASRPTPTRTSRPARWTRSSASRLRRRCRAGRRRRPWPRRTWSLRAARPHRLADLRDRAAGARRRACWPRSPPRCATATASSCASSAPAAAGACR